MFIRTLAGAALAASALLALPAPGSAQVLRVA